MLDMLVCWRVTIAKDVYIYIIYWACPSQNHYMKPTKSWWNMGLRHQRYSHEKTMETKHWLGWDDWDEKKSQQQNHHYGSIIVIFYDLYEYIIVYIYAYIYNIYYVYYMCIYRYIDIENHCHSNGNTVGIYKQRFGMLAWCCLNSCVTHTFFMPSLFNGILGFKKNWGLVWKTVIF